jgi:thiamine biosynthesis lipoprotein
MKKIILKREAILYRFDKKGSSYFLDRENRNLYKENMKKNKWRNLINIGIFLTLLVIAIYQSQNRVKSYQKSALVMDTFVEIQLESKSDDGEKLLAETFKLMRQYEEKLNFYDASSQVSMLNDATNYQLDSDLFRLFEISQEVYENSAHYYDVTIGDLAMLWDIENKIIPQSSQIVAALENTGFDKLAYEQKTLQKPQQLKINFGSLAKGYIIDKAVEFLQQRSVESVVINAGGDIRIAGKSQKIKIGIQHPRGKSGEILAKLQVGNQAVVSSGDYERYFVQDEVRYHHLLNPLTGYPARENISVTVIGEEAVWADAYATAFFVMPHAKALQLADEIAGIELLIVYEEDNKIKTEISSNMKRYLGKDVRDELLD